MYIINNERFTPPPHTHTTTPPCNHAPHARVQCSCSPVASYPQQPTNYHVAPCGGSWDINYTIIIPHKDIPDLLQRCLDSIPQRDDVQVIVVDDNSDPGKVDFSRFPGLEREGVECYFTKAGKGAGYARNVGLEHARGKWLLFADADDMFTDGLLSVLDRYGSSGYDVIYFTFDDAWDDPDKKIVKRTHDAVRFTTVTPNPVAKMIRRDLFFRHSIKFDEVHVSNDVMAMFAVASCAIRDLFVDEVIYLRIHRHGSLSCLETQSLADIWCRLKVECRAMNSYPQYDENHYWLWRIREFGRFHFYKAVVYAIIKTRSLKCLRVFLKFQIRGAKNIFKQVYRSQSCN